MDTTITVTEDVFYVGANDRETALFEAIWPLPRGVSYNSYLIKDEKVALIDCVKTGHLSGVNQRIAQILDQGQTIDYLVVNHMEPDHSGAIRELQCLHPKCKIVCNKRTLPFLENFYGIKDGLHVVDDGDVLDLGKHKLQFHLTPMVHWPETMMTYDTKDKVLFSGDAFGGFGALETGVFDDQVDIDFYEDEILRYFTNIVAKYSPMVQKAFAKVGGLDIQVVAPTHGIVWRHDPNVILGLYDKWSRQETEPGVTIVYASMYGNTAQMAESIGIELARQKVENARVHDISRVHSSFVLNDVWRYSGLILGTPTYNRSIFPLMNDFVRLLANKNIKQRHVGLFGTFGWSGEGVRNLKSFVEEMKGWEVVEPVIEARCSAKPEDYELCRKLAANMKEKTAQ
jgi:flavorubredoxin